MSGIGERDGGGPRLRPASTRGRGGGDGIATVEAFSRGDMIDRAWMGWGALRVLSRQAWAPGAVRDEGRVANMERLLVVLEGALEADCGALGRHRAGAGAALWIGAGHGLASRLANASPSAPLRLVELWLQPRRVNAEPAVAMAGPEEAGPGGDGAGAWHLLAGDGMAFAAVAAATGGAVAVARLGPGQGLGIPRGGARFWLEVLSGEADAGGVRLAEGDGLGWLAGDPAAPVSVAAPAGAAATLLLVVLPA